MKHSPNLKSFLFQRFLEVFFAANTYSKQSNFGRRYYYLHTVMVHYLIGIITSENSMSVLVSIYKLVSVMMWFRCVTVTVLLHNAIGISDCRDSLRVLLGVYSSTWSAEVEKCEQRCSVRFLCSPSADVLKEGRDFFGACLFVNHVCHCNHLLAAFVLVALNDYSLLMYVQGSSNFSCSCQKNSLEVLKKSMLSYFPSFLRVPWVLLGFSKSRCFALNRLRYH